MSIIEVKVPQLSESVSEGTVVGWKFKLGDIVKQDEIICSIETDKVILEVPSPITGKLVEIIKADQSMVVNDDMIAKINSEIDSSSMPATHSKTQQNQAEISTAQQNNHLKQNDKNGEHSHVQADIATAAATPVAAVAASPSAHKIMSEKGLKPEDITGTGRGGRITKNDAQNSSEFHSESNSNSHSQSGSQSVAPNTSNHTGSYDGERPEQRVPMSRLRARVAQRLLESQQSSAILTTFNEVNMAEVIALRNKYKEKFEKEHGVKLGFMSFFVKAAIHALKKYPIINASVDGSDIIYHGYFDVGIAVGSPRGLVVPILKEADKKTIADIEKQIVSYGNKAKDGKLSLEDLTGGTFSISNGGVFGSMLSTPIINPPQSAILGVHATKDRAVVENGQIVIRPMNYLALSYDHRIIDGREAVLFLVAIKDALEDPARLLLDI